MFRHVFDSPILRMLTVLNVIALALLSAPLFWPMPIAQTSADPYISAADIAGYLGETPLVIAEATDRPLFHANRRRPVAEVVEQVAVAQPVVQQEVFTLELVGVMGATADSRTAFILDAASAETYSVRVGGFVNDWSVTAIDASSVSLNRDGQQKTLSMN